uniref:NADH-ubiquinone oxidoreductase chain 2 n=1 Tax=Cyrestis thyodamas TaxID=224106 RepID=A0A0A7AU15_9NEOP|nr:NADH dehydrogenase subunit 2 [Cyrestis thyodamas]AHL17265.1 NADH dehydrogenase subunit 2 [Cyrestis thyodamas]
MMNSNKMFFFFILFFSTLISVSSNSWIGCWIGLEINLLSFIPLLTNPNNLMNSEASLKYFLTQSIASINFLFSILINMMIMKNFFMDNLMSMLINSSMLMKMGSTPFHFWFPNIVEGLSWLNCLILMTWQKISPMILLSYYLNLKFLFFIMILNVLIGTISSFNQLSLRKLMAFSSINNLGWLLSALMISENLWMTYIFMYSFFMYMCFLFYITNIYYMNQLFNFNLNFYLKIFIFINFLSLGGLPPFLGFFPKWMIINYLLMNNLFIISFIFIMTSLIMMFIYIRIMYSSLLFQSIKLKWFKINIKNNFLILINLFSFISMLGMIMSTFIFF